MTVSVRAAVDADLPLVSALLVQTWHATYDPIYGADKVKDITEAWHKDAVLNDQLTNADMVFLVAEQDSHIVGTALLERENETSAKMVRLYVSPEFHRQGVGGALMRASLASVATCEQMSLEVEPANENAIAFYERAGFVETGRVANCGGGDSAIPAIVMTKMF